MVMETTPYVQISCTQLGMELSEVRIPGSLLTALIYQAGSKVRSFRRQNQLQERRTSLSLSALILFIMNEPEGRRMLMKRGYSLDANIGCLAR